MKKLAGILMLLLCSTLVYAQWNVEIKVTGTLPGSTNIFDFKADIEEDISNNLQDAQIIFNIDLDTNIYLVELTVTGKTTTQDLDAFAITIKNYFSNKFDNGEIDLSYSKSVKIK